MVINADIRVPVQKRSREKFEQTLQAAEKLISEQGVDNTSIPEISKLTGSPRATIYQYFPDKNVLFAYLAERHMQKLTDLLEETHQASECQDWQRYIHDLLHTSADYYNAHPVAKVLLLNGPFGDSDMMAHKLKHQTLSKLILTALDTAGVDYQFPDSPDVLIIAIEIGFAIIRYGYWYEEQISAEVLDQAELVIVNYLQQYLS